MSLGVVAHRIRRRAHEPSRINMKSRITRNRAIKRAPDEVHYARTVGKRLRGPAELVNRYYVKYIKTLFISFAKTRGNGVRKTKLASPTRQRGRQKMRITNYLYCSSRTLHSSGSTSPSPGHTRKKKNKKKQIQNKKVDDQAEGDHTSAILNSGRL